ncbi:MAG: sigma-70 family RNA polymerase sigma factor, partial [Planctomycetota bacterium]
FEDAVLGTAHELAVQDRMIADEFLGHFLVTMMKLGHFAMLPGLRRFLDSGDLVDSVAGEIWRDLMEVEFRTRREFLAYLGRRLKWKASDRQRGLQAGRRREDLRRDPRTPEGEPVELPAPASAPGPSTILARREEQELLAAALVRLPERDREVLQRHLRGESHEQVAAALGLRPATARQALHRAIERARALIG